MGVGLPAEPLVLTMSSLGKRKYTAPSSRRAVAAKRLRTALPVRIVKQPSMRGRMPGLPRETMVTMKYSTHVNQTSSSGVLTAYAFRANSIFDPDATGTGHQPSGHDQWAQLYGQYVVKSARFKISACVVSGNAVTDVIGVYLSPANVLTATTFAELIEQGKSTWMLLPASAANPARRLSCSYDAKTEYNIKDVKDNVARIGAAFGANPTEQCFFVVWLQSIDASTSTTTSWICELEYDVIMSEPKEIPQS